MNDKKTMIPADRTLKGRRSIILKDEALSDSKIKISAGTSIRGGSRQRQGTASAGKGPKASPGWNSRAAYGQKKRSMIPAGKKLAGRKSKITYDEPLSGTKRKISAGERIGGRNTISSDEQLQRREPKKGTAIGGAARKSLKAGGRAIADTSGKLKWTGQAVYEYTDGGAGQNENRDETSVFYDPVTKKAGENVKTAADAPAKAAQKVSSSAKKIVRKASERKRKEMERKIAGKTAKATGKAAARITQAAAKAAAEVAKAAVEAVKALVALIIEYWYVFLIIAAVLLVAWLVISIASLPQAPLSWTDPESGELVEQPLEDYLGDRVHELREAFIEELLVRKAELEGQGYNHISIWNLDRSNSLGENTVNVADIRDTDCGLISEAEYIDRLRPVYNACLMARYGESYTESNAREVVEEIFALFTYRIEVPLNDCDGDGTGDYVYCDGTRDIIDNSTYTSHAFYYDGAGLRRWPGCESTGTRCWNCDANFSYHDPETSGNPCAYSYPHCPGHPDTSTDPPGTSYCTPACSTAYGCRGYKNCHGHKEIDILIGNGSADDILQKYFLEPIAQLEGKENLTDEERAQLANLRAWYEIAKNSLENPVDMNGGTGTEGD